MLEKHTIISGNMSRREEIQKELGLKTKEQMLEMTVEELDDYEDALYWNRADAITQKNWVKKFGHIKQLNAPEVVDAIKEIEDLGFAVVNDMGEEE